jgi:hypothetical protein
MPEMEAYKKLLASQPENETYYECVTLSHSLFSKTYYLVVDSQPLTAQIPTGQLVTFEPASIAPTNAQNSNDLDQSVSFTISDVENILDSELDRIPLGNQESPIAAYSIYHSDFLNSPVEHTAYTVKSVPQKKGAFTVKAGAPDLNSDETGEIYDLDRFPPLRSVF